MWSDSSEATVVYNSATWCTQTKKFHLKSFSTQEKISHTLPKKLTLSLFDRADNSAYPKKSIFQIKKQFLIISGKNTFLNKKKHFTCAKK